MEHNYTYFLEKVGQCLHRLLIHQGNSKERLMDEGIEFLAHSSEPMPDHFYKERWDFVIKELKKIFEDKIEPSNELASKIIEYADSVHNEIKWIYHR